MQCPGQDSRYWDNEAIFETKCAKCAQVIEFFKDDSTRTCRNCGHRMVNPRIDFGCAAYCPYAEQCLGTLPSELLAKKKELLKDRVAIEMKRYFGSDFKRIGHATRVARYAEEMAAGETDAVLAVILITAYLHDIGLHETERKYQSTAARYQHQEGPPIARDILTRLGASEELINEVCDIVGHHHHPRPEETVNFKVLYDADLLVNLEESQKDGPTDQKKLARIVAKSFLTESGRAVAAKILFQPGH